MGLAGSRTALVAALAGVALLVAAAAAGAPGDPQRHFEPRDQARARALVLRAIDLPARNWVVKPTDFSGANPACLVKHYSLAALTATGEAGSTFTLGGGLVSVESDGHVFRTAGEAGRALAVSTKPGLGRCIGTALAASIHRDEPALTARLARVEPVAVSPARGWRVLLRISTGKQRLTTEVVQLALVRGRSLSSVGFVSTVHRWPAATLRSIVGKAARRLARG